MTTFQWKKKTKMHLESNIFVNNNDEENTVGFEEIDWMEGLKRKKCFLLEDCVMKSKRLVEEGIKIAECDRYWEAIHKWIEAANLTPNNSTIYEMTAQAYMEVGEIFPAVKAAEKAADLDTNWYVAHQTLGRAQLGIGEVGMALKSFCRAIHLNPADSELWEQDLKWAISLQNVTHNGKMKKESEINPVINEKDLTCFEEIDRNKYVKVKSLIA